MNSWVDVFGLLGKEELAQVQKMGAEAEVLAQNKFGFTKNTKTIDSIINNKKHIPDGKDIAKLYEVKCVGKQGYTTQIKSYVDFAEKNNLEVILIVDNTTTLSKPLQKAIDNGDIKLETMDLKYKSLKGCK